jgi:CBS domain-containing protein
MDLVQAMRLSGIRRVPVVDARGALSGVVALDDLIGVISGLLCEVSGSIKSEQRQEWRARQ